MEKLEESLATNVLQRQVCLLHAYQIAVFKNLKLCRRLCQDAKHNPSKFFRLGKAIRWDPLGVGAAFFFEKHFKIMSSK